jgi:hypothetical protein
MVHIHFQDGIDFVNKSFEPHAKGLLIRLLLQLDNFPTHLRKKFT